MKSTLTYEMIESKKNKEKTSPLTLYMSMVCFKNCPVGVPVVQLMMLKSSERCHLDRVVFSTLMRTATNIIRKLSIIYHDLILYIIRRTNTSKCKSGLLQIEVATATKKKLFD